MAAQLIAPLRQPFVQMMEPLPSRPRTKPDLPSAIAPPCRRLRQALPIALNRPAAPSQHPKPARPIAARQPTLGNLTKRKSRLQQQFPQVKQTQGAGLKLPRAHANTKRNARPTMPDCVRAHVEPDPQIMEPPFQGSCSIDGHSDFASSDEAMQQASSSFIIGIYGYWYSAGLSPAFPLSGLAAPRRARRIHPGHIQRA